MPQIPAHSRPNGHQKWRRCHRRTTKRTLSVSGLALIAAPFISGAVVVAIVIAGARLVGALS